MNGKLTTRFFAGLFLLLGSFVLAYIIVAFYSRAQVAPLMRSGPGATDFAAPYFFVINRGAFLGLLLAFGLFGYWRLRVDLSAGAAQRLRNHEATIRFMLLFAPYSLPLLRRSPSLSISNSLMAPSADITIFCNLERTAIFSFPRRYRLWTSQITTTPQHKTYLLSFAYNR